MFVENPKNKEPLHRTLAKDSTAQTVHWQDAFTNGTLTYKEGCVYVNDWLSSIGETLLLDIPNTGLVAVPFIAQLDGMKIPIFKKVLKAYELKRASLRNEYIRANLGSGDYKDFLADLARKHPNSKSTDPVNLYQARSWLAGLGTLTDQELDTLAKHELPKLFGTIIKDMKDIPLKELNGLLQSAGLAQADASEDKPFIHKLLDERQDLLQELIIHAQEVIRKSKFKITESTFAQAYAQLDKTTGQPAVDKFFESKATKMSA